jgi:hypothetical protein
MKMIDVVATAVKAASLAGLFIAAAFALNMIL